MESGSVQDVFGLETEFFNVFDIHGLDSLRG
jgi:hypothetical protein